MSTIKIFIIFGILIFTASCSQSVFPVGKIYEGKFRINKDYINDSLGFSISILGLDSLVINPNSTIIQSLLGNTFISNFKSSGLQKGQNILLAQSSTIPFKPEKFDLFRAYKLAAINYSLSAYKQDALSELKKLGISVSISDTGKNYNINGNAFVRFIYSIQQKNSYKSIVEYATISNSYLVRFIYVNPEKNIKSNQIEDKTAHNSMWSYSVNFVRKGIHTDVTQADFLLLTNNGNYLEVLNAIKSSKDSLNPKYKTILATYTMYCGDYKNALNLKPSPDQKFEPIDTSTLLQYIPESAAHLIQYIPDSSRIVFISADELNPSTILFVRNTLPSLAARGFDWLCFDHINNLSDFMSVGARENNNDLAQYSNDPVYENLLKFAIERHFNTAAHGISKAYANVNPDIAKEKNSAARDLAEWFHKNPKSKFVVLVNKPYYGINQTDYLQKLSTEFKHLTGVQPFCIDQVEMTEGKSLTLENPLYTFAINNFKLKEHTIFTKDAHVFVPTSKKNNINVQVFHSRTVFDNNGYNAGLLMRDNYKKTFAFKGSEYKNTLFQIFNNNPEEKPNYFINTTPVLNLLLTGNNTFDISLESGKYYFQVMDVFGKKIVPKTAFEN